MIKPIILFTLLLICSLQISTIYSEELIEVEKNPESRGILSSIGGGLHEKMKKFVTTVKDILLGHHKKIGSFHFRLKECLEKLVALEKRLLGLKDESYSCPDITHLVDKVKEKIYANEYNVNPNDVNIMAGHLQNYLRTLEHRLQQDSKYLSLAFDHIKYLHAVHPSSASSRPAIYLPKPIYGETPNPSIKMRDGNNAYPKP